MPIFVCISAVDPEQNALDQAFLLCVLDLQLKEKEGNCRNTMIIQPLIFLLEFKLGFLRQDFICSNIKI